MPASNGVESVYVDGQLIQRQVSEVRIDGQGRRVVIFFFTDQPIGKHSNQLW